MARKLRLEFPGACYHVINRGNYRGDIFANTSAKAAFELCLFEACERSAWLLHAFAIMRNHYHLAIETPLGNLVDGMQWLQATFASRFNRFRKESGHLFQGRYKAILVEPGEPLAAVCDYIHLNPMRAGIVKTERLGDYRYSSYWYLRRPRLRPNFLRSDLMLGNAGGLGDGPDGWNQYQRRLAGYQADLTCSGKSGGVSLSQGWAIGGPAFKASLTRDHAIVALSRAWEKKGAHEIRLGRWEKSLAAGLCTLGRNEASLETRPRSAPWKVALALFLKIRSDASNRWLAERLQLGGAKYVSHLLSATRRARRKPAEFYRLQAAVQQNRE